MDNNHIDIVNRLNEILFQYTFLLESDTKKDKGIHYLEGRYIISSKLKKEFEETIEDIEVLVKSLKNR